MLEGDKIIKSVNMSKKYLNNYSKVINGSNEDMLNSDLGVHHFKIANCLANALGKRDLDVKTFNGLTTEFFSKFCDNKTRTHDHELIKRACTNMLTKLNKM